MALHNLLNNIAVTGPAVVVQRPGKYAFVLSGTISGATVTLQTLADDNATYVGVENGAAVALTAAKSVIVDLPAGTYRALVAGGTPANLYASLRSTF